MKTNFLSVPFAYLLSLLFISCQKELSTENELSGGGTALYSLNGGTGSCTGATLSGSFTEGTPATAANTATLSVIVDSVGSYFISTSTVNGLSFSGSGVFTITGLQDITLIASGTPAIAGIYDFTPVANGCTFSVNVTANNGGTSGTADYSFDGGTSSCTGAVVTGTFTAGTAVSSGNMVVLNIMVDTVGTYTITTNSANGITFTGTGSFTTTGAQTVILTGSGTPVASGTFTFTPGANGCSFNVTVNSPGGGSGGSSGNFLKCKIDGVAINFNKSLIGYYITSPNSGIPYSISAQGKNSDVAGSTEELWVTVSNPTAPTTGIYNNFTFLMNATDRACQVGFFPTGFPNPGWSVSGFNANTMTVNITSVSASGAAGTFQGTIYETSGLGPAFKQITDGAFKISY